MAVEIVLETHSLSEDNERGVATGWLDGRLSERGRELARELGGRRRSDGLDAVFASDLGRAVETAEIAFRGVDVARFLDWRLRECNYGEWNGMPVERLAAERASRLHVPFPGGESWTDAVARVDGFLDDAVRRWDGKRILVIGHVATRWALDRRVHGTALEELLGTPFEWREGWTYVLAGGDAG